MDDTGCADAVLDALALIEARLRDDGQALTHLLDAGDNRAQASMTADIAAHLMRVLAPADPLGMFAHDPPGDAGRRAATAVAPARPLGETGTIPAGGPPMPRGSAHALGCRQHHRQT